MKAKIISWIYLAVGLANITAHLLQNPLLDQYTKPLLMPLLIFYLFEKVEGVVTLPRLLLGAALIFSWGGDIALMYPGEMSFMLGLGSFLIAQVIYIIIFNKTVFQPINLQLKLIWPLLVYGVLLLVLILPYTGGLTAPVVLYATCLLSMCSVAILRHQKTTGESFRMVTYGAILFVLSDSIIALNKFGFPIEYYNVGVMITYISAQYMLVEGIIRHPA